MLVFKCFTSIFQQFYLQFTMIIYAKLGEADVKEHCRLATAVQ